MLSRIEIRNFAIIQLLDLDWSDGMTVVTGETGAGKSIVIDALGLTLGEKADPAAIYPNAERAEITSIFDSGENSSAALWLQDQGLQEENECILRRVISHKGRSKCFINGRSATLSQLKQLGSLLVDIHGQHQHQSLLKSKEQLNLLDSYANHLELLADVKQAYQHIQQIDKRKKQLEQDKQNRLARYELLSYQVSELQDANPQASVLNSLVEEHKQAATLQERSELTETTLQFLCNDETQSCLSQLSQVIKSLAKLNTLDSSIANALDTLIQAQSLLEDVKNDLNHYQDNLGGDPEILSQLDQQLALFHDLARKHKVSLEELPQYFQQLQEQLKQLNADESELQEIEKSYQTAVQHYQKKAEKLSQSRKKSAQKLQKLITQEIQTLAMQGGNFSICLSPSEQAFTASGSETIDFLVATNPGQALQPLNKVASGGELSRISLAIAVITAKHQPVPTIIFDEVDVGIGGATAEIVGRLLRQLSAQRQVFCVTHQPQVAACGKHHYRASKIKQLNNTITKVDQLDDQQRVAEIGRMLGGIKISDKTLSHAKEMLGI